MRSIRVARRTAWIAGLTMCGLACGDLRVSLGDGLLDGGATDAPLDQDSNVVDAGADDGAPPVRQCPHGAPFATSKLVAGFESTDVWSARLSPDERTIFLSIPRNPGTATDFDLYSAGRTETDQPFGVQQKLSISTATDDYWPTVRPDGLVMFFESGLRPDGATSSSRIWFASRTSVPGNFEAVLLDYFASVPETVTEGVPYLVPSGKKLYWASIGREGKTSLDLWAADVTGAGAVVTPFKLDVSTANDDSYPVVTDDDLELFFGHDLPTEGDDIYVSVRPPTATQFPAPVKVEGPINTLDDREWSSWISPDSCRLYFIRKSGTNETARLYVAERSKP